MKTEKEIIKKLDIKLIPFLTIIYLLCYLDRVNIGYAKLLNIEELNLSPSEYSACLSIFFVGYILFELPSNLVLKLFSPQIWISRIMITWGIVTISMAYSSGFYYLLIGRLLLGIFEAGLAPGIIFYLSFWYTKKEQSTRIACFLSASIIAGSFGGFIAFSIDKLNLVLNLKSWQWIFIIEGVPSVIIGIITYFYLPGLPTETKWFKEEEKEILVNRLKKDKIEVEEKSFNKKQFIDTFKDYKLYFYIFMSIGIGTTLNCMALLLPSIIKDLGFDYTTSLLMSPPPYIISLFTSIGMSYNSDRKNERGYHMVFTASIGAIGYLLMIFIDTIYAKYLGCILVIVGVTSCGPIHLSWMSNNMNGSTKTAVASALTISFGNLGGIIAGQLYKTKDLFVISSIFNLCLLLFTILLAIILKYLLKKENKKLNIEKSDVVYVL